MASKKKSITRRKTAAPGSIDSGDDPGVAEFMRTLDHPLKRELEAIRRIILGVSPEVREGIKWNAPSFRTTDFFATVNLRSGERAGTHSVWLILHTGARTKETTGLK